MKHTWNILPSQCTRLPSWYQRYIILRILQICYSPSLLLIASSVHHRCISIAWQPVVVFFFFLHSCFLATPRTMAFWRNSYQIFTISCLNPFKIRRVWWRYFLLLMFLYLIYKSWLLQPLNLICLQFGRNLVVWGKTDFSPWKLIFWVGLFLDVDNTMYHFFIQKFIRDV